MFSHFYVYFVYCAFSFCTNRLRTGRNKLPIEVIGTYNPIPAPLTEAQHKRGELPVKEIHLDVLRAKYWIGVGAQPTETVARLFKKLEILGPWWPAPHSGPAIPERRIVKTHQFVGPETHKDV